MLPWPPWGWSWLPTAPPVPPPEQSVLLLSLDGFRWDYVELHKELVPNLRRLLAEGSSAERMLTVSPSKTLASHWSIITGLPPVATGILENNFLDAQGRRFDAEKGERQGHWWQRAEPLWVTAERQGVRTAPLLWPGSGAGRIRGVLPSYAMEWDGADDVVDFGAELTEVRRLLRLPHGQRPRFLTTYWDGVDHAGHRHGPDSRQLRAALAEADGLVGQLLATLDEEGWGAERMNVVVVSDHGMARVRPSCTLELSVVLSRRQLRALDFSHPRAKLVDGLALAQLRPKASLPRRRRAKLLRELVHALSPKPPPSALARSSLAGTVAGEGKATAHVDSVQGFPSEAPPESQSAWVRMRCGCKLTLKRGALGSSDDDGKEGEEGSEEGAAAEQRRGSLVLKGSTSLKVKAATSLLQSLKGVTSLLQLPIGRPHDAAPAAVPTTSYQPTTSSYQHDGPDSSGGRAASAAHHGPSKGNHGYEPASCGGVHRHAMDALFVARGPAFASGGAVARPFSSLAVYGLLCRVLGLEPSDEYAAADQAPLEAASVLLVSDEDRRGVAVEAAPGPFWWITR